MYGEQVLDGKFRIVIDKKIIDIRKFDMVYKTGLTIMVAEDFTLRAGSLDEEVEVIEEPKEEEKQEAVANGPVLTQEQIINEINKDRHGRGQQPIGREQESNSEEDSTEKTGSEEENSRGDRS